MTKCSQTRFFSAISFACAAFVACAVIPSMANAGGMPRIEEPPAVEPEKTAGTAPFDVTDPKRIKAGEETFNSTCAAYCHGQNPTLFVDRTGLTEEYVYNTIRDGGKGATPMPPWGDVFSHEEIWELVAYLKSLGKW